MEKSTASKIMWYQPQPQLATTWQQHIKTTPPNGAMLQICMAWATIQHKWICYNILTHYTQGQLVVGLTQRYSIHIQTTFIHYFKITISTILSPSYTILSLIYRTTSTSLSFFTTHCVVLAELPKWTSVKRELRETKKPNRGLRI